MRTLSSGSVLAMADGVYDRALQGKASILRPSSTKELSGAQRCVSSDFKMAPRSPQGQVLESGIKSRSYKVKGQPCCRPGFFPQEVNPFS